MNYRAVVAPISVSLAVLLGSVACGTYPSGSRPVSPADDAGLVLIERSFRRPWQSECFEEGCSVPIIATVKVHAPPSSFFDVLLTATLDYTTSRGDFGTIYAQYSSEGIQLVPMRPGGFDLRSPEAKRTTTTLAWTAKNLSSEQEEYEFELEAPARDEDLNGAARFGGRALTIAIQITPS